MPPRCPRPIRDSAVTGSSCGRSSSSIRAACSSSIRAFPAEHWQAVQTVAPVDIRPIRAVLAQNGVRPDDVRLIANCHFHSDHAGGNRDFPSVPIFVQRSEVAHLRATPDHRHAPSVADFAGALELALRGEPHGPYPEWVARFGELDPWRVVFAHDTAHWQRSGADRPIG